MVKKSTATTAAIITRMRRSADPMFFFMTTIFEVKRKQLQAGAQAAKPCTNSTSPVMKAIQIRQTNSNLTTLLIARV